MRTKQLVTVCLAAALATLAACERPPIESEQVGYRGTGMVNLQNPRLVEADGEYPAAMPQASGDGPRAGDVYQNVQVLGDLSVAQFTRLMTAMTQWVSPEAGCNYCHLAENLASDDIYTKVVSRRMIQMTQHINSDYESHVGGNGVNCYTCHRGNNVPEYIWFSGQDNVGGMTAYAGNLAGQNAPAESVALASLPNDPFTPYLTEQDAQVRVVSENMLATEGGATIQDTERTYGLMMHFSDSLGVNCNPCHNSRIFSDWSNSNPARWTAWHGLEMVQSLNEDYLVPLEPVYPAGRLGPTGDAPKAYCLTCHQGYRKPLGGGDAVGPWPSLAGR